MKKKNLLITISLTFIIIVTVVVLLIKFNIFKKSQGDLASSLSSGYGFYGDPTEGPCITRTGHCGETGTKTITKNCIVNPVTKKGCILKDGTMGYDNLVETVACKRQCVAANFTVNNGVNVKEFVDIDNIEFEIPVGSGGGYLVDSFGIDHTDTFVESFNTLENKYKTKRCLNTNEYIGYSIEYLRCDPGDDIRAGNKCVFTCGSEDLNVLRQDINLDTNTNIKTYNYPKINGHYTCLDLFGNNQIESLNQGSVPADFIYPSQCFNHYLKTGTSINLNLTNNIVKSQYDYSFDRLDLDSYNIIYDYNFYQPIKAGFMETIVQKITHTDKKIVKNLFGSRPGYLYLDMESDYTTGNNLNLGTEILQKELQYYTLENTNIIALDLFFFFPNDLENSSPYYFKDGTMFLDYTGTVNIGDFILYSIDNNNIDNKSDIAKVTLHDNTENYIGVSVNDLGKNAYLYGIKFGIFNSFFSEPLNLYNQTGGLSPGNRINNNKYFISDLLLPRNNYSGFNSNTDLVYFYNSSFFITSISDNNDDIFYVYSPTTKSFYYPVTVSQNIYTSNYNFTLPEYNDTKFYLLEGGVSNTIYPPAKDLGYKSFSELNGFIRAKPILASYGTSYVNHIKSFILTSDNFIDNPSFSNGEFVIYTEDFTDFYTPGNLNTISKEGTTITTLNTLASDIDSKTNLDKHPFVQKMQIYSEIMFTKVNNFINHYPESYTFNIQPQKAILKIADFDVFKTPDLVDSNTDKVITKNVCFDNFGKPLQRGTKIQLQPGEKIVYYKNNNLNADNFVCGFYGVSGGVSGEKVSTERIELLPNLGTSTLVSRDINKYYNYLDFLEPGYIPEKLYCYKGISRELVSSTVENCREPYITKNYTNNYYNSNETVLDYHIDKNIYLSRLDNNTLVPNNPNNWIKLLDYGDRDYVIENNNVYSYSNNHYFVYTANNRGLIGEDISKFAIYYLYKKSLPFFEDRYMDSSAFAEYNLNTDYYQYNVLQPTGSDPNNMFINNQKGLILNLNQSSNFTYGVSIEATLKDSGTSLYSYALTIDTAENFSVNDYFNPDFNLFNSILIDDGISTFSANGESCYHELISGSSIITNTTINSNLTKDSLIFIAYDNTIDYFETYSAGISIYNYAFEVCKVLDFNTENKTVTLERNLLDYPRSSNFVGLNFDYMAYKLDPNLKLNSLYSVNNVDDTKITFNFNAYSKNTPNITNILSNFQSRTFLSARIIKNNITIPSSITPDNSTNLYLLSSPKKNKVSAYLEYIIRVDLGNNNYGYYFNEYKSNTYLNNKADPTFNPGDTLSVLIEGVNYEFLIFETKKNYQNFVYDYYSISSLVVAGLRRLEPPTTEFTKPLNNYIQYYNFRKPISGFQAFKNDNRDFSSITPNNVVLNTISPDHRVSIKIYRSNISLFINPENFNNNVYQEVTKQTKSLTTTDQKTFISNMLKNQREFDKGNLPILKLSKTRLYLDIKDKNNYITIGNIKLNTKPFGPSYLRTLANSNDLDLEGYGTITDFEITTSLDSLNITPSNDIVLTSLGGFKFSFSQEIASFTFNTVFRESNLKNYENNKTYSLDNPVNYNYTKKIYYENINNRVSLFNGETKEYSQPYYVFKNNQYTYPLYLEFKTDMEVFDIEGANDIKLYFDPSNVIISSTIPNLNIYKLFDLTKDLKSIPSWRQVKESIYPVIELRDYSESRYYLDGQEVIYKENVYVSIGENYNNPPIYGVRDSWKLIDSLTNLYDSNGYLYNLNTGASITPVGLSLPIKDNIDNFPYSVIDYGTCTNYYLKLFNKGVLDYNDNFSSSFLGLDIFSEQLKVLGQAIIFKSGDNVISLASSPVSSDNIENYSFLKEYSNNNSKETLSQYIYNIKLPNQESSGNIFCTGNTPFSSDVTVDNYSFANSILFVPVPVDIEYQDYPKITISNTNIYTNPPLAIPHGNNKVIRNSNNNFSLVDIGVSSSRYLLVKNKDINNGVGGRLVSSNPPTFDNIFTYNVDNSKLNYYLNYTESFFDFGENIDLYDNAPWYLENGLGENIASGYLRLEDINTISNGINPLNNLFIGSLNSDLLERNNDYTFYLNDTLKIENVEIFTMPNKLNLNKDSNFPLLEGEYYFFKTLTDINNRPEGVSEKFRAYLSFDSNNNVLEFNQYHFDSSVFTNNDKIYFLPKNGTSTLKIKMYGFFMNEYLTSVNYRGDSTIASTKGRIPNLILSPFKNRLLNPYYNTIELVDSNGTTNFINNISEENYSDIFNLESDGVSLNLKTNFFKYPIFNDRGEINKNNTPLKSAIGASGNNVLGAITTSSTTDFVSEALNFNNYIRLGKAEEVIPFDDKITNKNQYFREIKTASNTNIDSLLNCSIYNNDRVNYYRFGQTFSVKIDTINGDKVLNLIDNTNIDNFVYNTSNNLVQNDSSNNNYPLYLGISPSESFANSIFYGEKNLDSQSNIIVKYMLNGNGVSYSTYYNLEDNINYNSFVNRSIDIVMTKNNHNSNIEDKNIYLGYKNNLGNIVPFSTKGVSVLTFSDYS